MSAPPSNSVGNMPSMVPTPAAANAACGSRLATVASDELFVVIDDCCSDGMSAEAGKRTAAAAAVDVDASPSCASVYGRESVAGVYCIIIGIDCCCCGGGGGGGSPNTLRRLAAGALRMTSADAGNIESGGGVAVVMSFVVIGLIVARKSAATVSRSFVVGSVTLVVAAAAAVGACCFEDDDDDIIDRKSRSCQRFAELAELVCGCEKRSDISREIAQRTALCAKSSKRTSVYERRLRSKLCARFYTEKKKAAIFNRRLQNSEQNRANSDQRCAFKL